MSESSIGNALWILLLLGIVGVIAVASIIYLLLSAYS